MRYFVRQHERLIADHRQTRTDYQSSLRGIVADQSAANAKLMVCLDNNYRVLEECRDELKLCREERRYRQVRNRKVNKALVQGVKTARAILETPPQGRQADAQFVKWLMEHQKEAGIFTVVSSLVDRHSDNPAARLTAQEILERMQRAQGST